MTPVDRRHLLELWLLAGDGRADDAQLAKLNDWLVRDADARAYVLQVASQQGWLTWNASNLRLPEAFGESTEVASATTHRETEQFARCAPRRRTRRLEAASALVVAAALLIGFMVGQWAPMGRPKLQERAASVQATMVSSTGCLWGPGLQGNAAAHRQLVGGDALQLLEGIAEFRIGLGSSDVCLQMEGPASVVLTTQGGISLRYGKIIVTTGDHADRYAVETSFGRVLIEPNAKTGLVSFGSTEEIHSFAGEATVESPWLASADLAGGAVVTEGKALHLKELADGSMGATETAAQTIRFTLQMPMSHDFLQVGSDYVQEIVNSQPIAYWRFEGAEDGIVRNEVADRYHGRLKGKVGWVGPRENQAIEFGITPEPGSLVVAESWGELLNGDFSLEAWIKPSHYHLGSIVGFIGEFDWQDRRNKHGLLLEVNGVSHSDRGRQPKKIRLLHRPVLGVTGGISLYSEQQYAPRRWQHVAAVREGEEIRLYLNGELVQRADAKEALPMGLQLVVGQLYTETVERFFIGHVDEMAIYDRALSDREIKRRHELLRPSEKATTPLL
jgi:hypothetical protein